MRAALVCLISLAGCAQISGLDTLDVGDATSPVDGTSFEDALPKADAADASETADHDASDAKLDAKDASTLPDVIGGDVVSDACKSPASCVNGAVCCEVVNLSGTQQNCTVDAETIACTSPNACATSVPLNCTKYVLRRCIAASDCTETTYDKCCSVGDASTNRVCLNDALAASVNGTCL